MTRIKSWLRRKAELLDQGGAQLLDQTGVPTANILLDQYGEPVPPTGIIEEDGASGGYLTSAQRQEALVTADIGDVLAAVMAAEGW